MFGKGWKVRRDKALNRAEKRQMTAHIRAQLDELMKGRIEDNVYVNPPTAPSVDEPVIETVSHTVPEEVLAEAQEQPVEDVKDVPAPTPAATVKTAPKGRKKAS